MARHWSEILTLTPGKRSGKPCVRDLRITVYDVLSYLAAGMSEQEILAEFPELVSEDLRACLAFAADRERHVRTAA
ncbi:MAG: DUF433 domain-containing protein [Deltaproteobacteria bacterium]